MGGPNTMNVSPEDLQAILEAVLAKVQQLNPLEQRKYDEMVAKERRRDDLAVQIGKAEEEASLRRRNSCSHIRYGASSGKLSGHLAPKGTPGGEYTTGGQVYQNGLGMMFCSRCHSDWWFKPTPEYYAVLAQNGIDGVAPPPEENCICIGCYEPKPKCTCSERAREYVAAHPTVAAAGG